MYDGLVARLLMVTTMVMPLVIFLVFHLAVSAYLVLSPGAVTSGGAL